MWRPGTTTTLPLYRSIGQGKKTGSLSEKTRHTGVSVAGGAEPTDSCAMGIPIMV